MVWSVLINNKPTPTTPPTPEQVAAAVAGYNAPPTPPAPPTPNPNRPPVVKSEDFLALFTSDEVTAMTNEAIAEFAAGGNTFPQWWKKVSAGRGFVILNQANVLAIKALMVANGVLTQARADVIWAPPSS
jgi:hypothetical protein